ncbi:FAD-binding oxidoreductase [Elusimicrobiota bacterium]
MYNKITHKTYNRLCDIAGKDAVLIEPADISKYSKDETLKAFFPPDAVAFPSTKQMVMDIMKLANTDNFPVVPRGGGTSVTGGPLAVFGGLVLSFERFNKIEEIDTVNRMAVVKPGTINSVLQKEAAQLNLFYPINPASMDSCTLAGNVAEATGGANTVRYGTTRNYITGLKAVTGDAQIWKAGGKLMKNSTDHVLIQLMCGSEGTLSVFTELTIRLLPKPKYSAWIISPFDKIEKISFTAAKIFESNCNPTMVELMDSSTLQLCARYLNMDIQYSSSHQLLVRFDTEDKEEIERTTIKTSQICIDNGANDVLIADTKSQQDKIWKIRSSMHEALSNMTNRICEEDIVVPIGKINDLISKIYSISDDYDLRVMLFGHLGDGNLHINFSSETDQEKIISPEMIDSLRIAVFSAAVSMGGNLSGEHGIGVSKIKYFKKFVDPVYFKLLHDIKKDFDPLNILNPGKII